MIKNQKKELLDEQHNDMQALEHERAITKIDKKLEQLSDTFDKLNQSCLSHFQNYSEEVMQS